MPPIAVFADATDIDELTGLVGIAARVIRALGEWGVGLLTIVETVFPPIPSEVVLPLAGLLVERGSMSLVLVMITSTAGSVLGALALYWLGRRLGRDRAIALLAKLPLVDRNDFERGARWFDRHGRAAVFFSRLLPGARSLVSIPAGAARMNVGAFILFTAAGSAIWNGALIGLGMLLGTQYQLIDRYSSVLDWIVIAAVVGVIGWLVVRRIRRSRHAS